MSDAKSGGVSGMFLLFLLFLGLRLTDNIDWAWYWVAAPLWAPLAVVLLIAGLFFGSTLLVAGLAYVFGAPGRYLARRARLKAYRDRNGVPKL